MKIRVDIELTDEQVIEALARARCSGYSPDRYAMRNNRTYPDPAANVRDMLRDYLRENGVPNDGLDDLDADDVNDGLSLAARLGIFRNDLVRSTS